MNMNEQNVTEERRVTPPSLKQVVNKEQDELIDVSQCENNECDDNSVKDSEKDDDDFSWGGCIVVLVLAVAAVWALVHFNPSEQAHMDAIGEKVSDALVSDLYAGDDNVLINAVGMSGQMKKLKYKSIGICSWTYVKRHGHYELGSIGACGMVFPLIEVR